MTEIPNHLVPVYSEAFAQDAFFHYTNATGLQGILSTGELWSTAYYCANDESELAAGRGALRTLCISTIEDLIKANDPQAVLLKGRSHELTGFADRFEKEIVEQALTMTCAYITCFCRPHESRDFEDGLLSQWRGYGLDGGYALQFSRQKLMEAILATNNDYGLAFELHDVYYQGPHLREGLYGQGTNPMRKALYSHKDAFIEAFKIFLAQNGVSPKDMERPRVDPFHGLIGDPLSSLLRFLVFTKIDHFREERESRLSHIQPTAPKAPISQLPVQYLNRSGLLVPYTKTPASHLNILDCIEWIIIGPGPRMGARFKSLSQLIRQTGRKIHIRASKIPFTRF